MFGPGRVGLLSLLILSTSWPAGAQTPEAEDQRQQQVAERFQSLLEKTSRRGTALEEIYGYSLAALEDETRNSARGESSSGGPAIVAHSKQESLFQYHRPMLEDGQLEYEFFYEPGKTLVRPALDRLVFLLEPDGVKIHWLTDAQHERTGLTPDNVQTEPANRRGPAELPLRRGEWNHLQLPLSGLRATLSLNGAEIYQRPLEPINQRLFGLFHYADQTEVRVRRITWSGNWPRQLPSAEQLFARQN